MKLSHFVALGTFFGNWLVVPCFCGLWGGKVTYLDGFWTGVIAAVLIIAFYKIFHSLDQDF